MGVVSSCGGLVAQCPYVPSRLTKLVELLKNGKCRWREEPGFASSERVQQWDPPELVSCKIQDILLELEQQALGHEDCVVHDFEYGQENEITGFIDCQLRRDGFQGFDHRFSVLVQVSITNQGANIYSGGLFSTFAVPSAKHRITTLAPSFVNAIAVTCSFTSSMNSVTSVLPSFTFKIYSSMAL